MNIMNSSRHPNQWSETVANGTVSAAQCERHYHGIIRAGMGTEGGEYLKYVGLESHNLLQLLEYAGPAIHFQID